MITRAAFALLMGLIRVWNDSDHWYSLEVHGSNLEIDFGRIPPPQPDWPDRWMLPEIHVQFPLTHVAGGAIALTALAVCYRPKRSERGQRSNEGEN
jgi:hypothetical protein